MRKPVQKSPGQLTCVIRDRAMGTRWQPVQSVKQGLILDQPQRFIGDPVIFLAYRYHARSGRLRGFGEIKTMACIAWLIPPNHPIGNRLDQQIMKIMTMGTALAASRLGNIGGTIRNGWVDLIGVLRTQVLQM